MITIVYAQSHNGLLIPITAFNDYDDARRFVLRGFDFTGGASEYESIVEGKRIFVLRKNPGKFDFKSHICSGLSEENITELFKIDGWYHMVVQEIDEGEIKILYTKSLQAPMSLSEVIEQWHLPNTLPDNIRKVFSLELLFKYAKESNLDKIYIEELFNELVGDDLIQYSGCLQYGYQRYVSEWKNIALGILKELYNVYIDDQYDYHYLEILEIAIFLTKNYLIHEWRDDMIENIKDFLQSGHLFIVHPDGVLGLKLFFPSKDIIDT